MKKPPAQAAAQPQKPLTRAALIRGRFLSNRLAVAGLGVLVLLYLAAFLIPPFLAWDYQVIDYGHALEPPGARHWFGTNSIGQDVLAQTLRGLQKSLTIGLLVAVIAAVIAAFVGSVAGYLGGWAERAISWGVDLLLVLPGFLIIAVASPLFLGHSWLFLVLLLAMFSWMLSARVVRALTISLKQREFVIAAQYMGASPAKVVFSHILPNVASFLIIDTTLTVGSAIMSETGLSFFGFGVQPPDISLGTLIAEGSFAALPFPWLFAFAGGALVLTVLAANFAGDGLRDAFDPGAQAGTQQ
ncbi:binding-protein-dependent transport systems inner membrane component [Segniliparus rotundus DSM 44985]|uniref:Oligopeptide transport system permease protein OppC n=1 Tax=Segniliparus rotundus (strain ATCC BAA-972 / CDC 1076 / CIP 108378 / DSM 44985 / JCM 13578) TaxID=640132 RepID=D6ZEZ7_SEGRD|nr:ABC transporter permease [Segniliparus rotundus]ADG97521.1 binding-protein-dependent transport systems inner membrane component [Segniliparus rotundus DSM 44985]